jgi:hypothetical protein
MNFKRGRSPDIETISVEFSKNFKRGRSPDFETLFYKSVEFSKKVEGGQVTRY